LWLCADRYTVQQAHRGCLYLKRQSAEVDAYVVGHQPAVGVGHTEPVEATLAGLHIGRERLVADRDGERGRLPGAAGEALDLEDGSFATGVDPGQVDLLHGRDRVLGR